MVFKVGFYSEVAPKKLIFVLESWQSGWLLLTGGHLENGIIQFMKSN
jgi:hypothetical protein